MQTLLWPFMPFEIYKILVSPNLTRIEIKEQFAEKVLEKMYLFLNK